MEKISENILNFFFKFFLLIFLNAPTKTPKEITNPCLWRGHRPELSTSPLLPRCLVRRHHLENVTAPDTQSRVTALQKHKFFLSWGNMAQAPNCAVYQNSLLRNCAQQLEPSPSLPCGALQISAAATLGSYHNLSCLIKVMWNKTGRIS